MDSFQNVELPAYGVKKRDGRVEPLNRDKLLGTLERAGVASEPVSVKTILKETSKNIYDRVPTTDLETALILAASTFIERDPAYSRVAAKLFRQKIAKEVTGQSITGDDFELVLRKAFVANIHLGVEKKYLDERMLGFDLEKLASQLVFDRDHL
ncbi:MAG TPA: ATP cone domain-containing protein, partial [Spirochaetia bacterium]|nr:ATP cone domain-containing protein [Spirochaetia bacterium]